MDMKNASDDNHGVAKEENILQKIIRISEELFFSLILFSIVCFGLLPIITRNFNNLSFSWTEPLSRHFVLWLALFGAGAAAQDRKHINIDVISNFVSEPVKVSLRVFTGMISVCLCSIFFWYSIKFVIDERMYAYESSVSPSIPEWVFEIILPVGFFLLTIRILLVVIQDIVLLFKNSHKKSL